MSKITDAPSDLDLTDDVDIPSLLDALEALPGDWHSAGTLPGVVIREIHQTIEDAGVPVQYTAETGCGLSTLYFSRLGRRHECFTLPYDGLHRVQTSDLFRPSATTFILGPTQLTMPRHQFTAPLSVVLIDGPHAYPFPEIEYYFLYPHIQRGGLLIVDDIQIPTIGRLCEFLSQDAMWEHWTTAYTTAIFRRTDAPLFDPFGDGWWLQDFNRWELGDKAKLEWVYGEKWWERETRRPTTYEAE